MIGQWIIYSVNKNLIDKSDSFLIRSFIMVQEITNIAVSSFTNVTISRVSSLYIEYLWV